MSDFDLSPGIRWSLLSLGALVPIAAAVLVLIASLPEEFPTERSEPRRLCDARHLGPQCGSDHCVSGVCVRVPGARQELTECLSSVHCRVGAECHARSCREVEELPVAPSSCRVPRVEEVLRSLYRQCAAAAGVEPAEFSLNSCTAEMWEEISKAEHFERSLFELPGTFPVFFANGEPRKSGVRDEVRTHLQSRIHQHADVLKEARLVLVIGRASAVGNAADNRALARRRADLIAGIVDGVRGEGGEQAVAWGLADTLTFSANLLQPFFADSPIASAERDEASLRALAVDPRGIAERSDAANRMALVVPLPCDGSEFFPEPSLPFSRSPKRHD